MALSITGYSVRPPFAGYRQISLFHLVDCPDTSRIASLASGIKNHSGGRSGIPAGQRIWFAAAGPGCLDLVLLENSAVCPLGSRTCDPGCRCSGLADTPVSNKFSGAPEKSCPDPENCFIRMLVRLQFAAWNLCPRIET